MIKVVAKNGFIFEDFHFIKESDIIKDYGSIPGAHAVIKHDKKILFCYNKYRNAWELPGGGKDKNESLIDCIKREVYEESNQRIKDYNLVGISKIYVPKLKRAMNWAVYYTEISELNEFLENNEMKEMILWDLESDIGEVDAIDLAITKKVVNELCLL